MSFKRKINVATPGNARDPLRRFYNRKGYIKPLREDPSLEASAEDHGSKVRWSLGGWEQNLDLPKLATQKQMDDWLSAYKQDTTAQRHGWLEEIRSNDYLSGDGMGGIISLPNVFSKLRIDSLDRILRESGDLISARLSSMDVFHAGEPTEEAVSFYSSILATAKIDAPLYVHAANMLMPDQRRSEFQSNIIELETEVAAQQRRLEAAQDDIAESLDRDQTVSQARYDFVASLERRITELEREIAANRSQIAAINPQAFPTLDVSFRFGTLYLYAGQGADILADKIALYNAVRNVLGTETILNFLHFTPEHKRTTYEAVKFTIETPYVTRTEIYPFLELNAGLKNEQGISRINPEYLFYDENFEKAISGSNLPENVQPSMYIYDLSTSAITDNEGLTVSPGWQGDPSVGNKLQYWYSWLMRLAGNIPINQNLLNDTSLRDYLDSFAHEATCNLTEQQKSIINRMYRTIMVPATEMDTLNKMEEKKRFFPMYLETSFATSPQGDVGEIIEKNKTSSPVLEYLHAGSGRDKVYEIRADYLIGDFIDFPDDDMFKNVYLSKPLRVTELYEALNYGSHREVIDSLVISAHGLEPVTREELTVAQDANRARAFINVRSALSSRAKKYFSYLGRKTESPSEALGYRLTKRDEEGTKIQDIIFGNSGETKTINYVDTQVKYDKKYQYELSEFRLAVGTEYELFVVDAREPRELRTLNRDEIPDTLPPQQVFYDIVSIEKPTTQVIEVPIYGSFYEIPEFPGMEKGSDYPLANIMSHPPTAPDLQVLPLLDNFREIKLNTQLSTGEYVGSQALKVINVGQNEEKLQALYEYQKQFENYGLKPGHLEYKNEGVEEIQKVILLRSTGLNFAAPSYDDLYASFTMGEERVLSLNPVGDEEEVVSFDVLDTLETNVYYYYTCYVEDVHGNPSLPAPIYRVRLVYEKGLFVPEIELFQYKPISTKAPSRRFSRFIRIGASDIQTFPFFDLGPDGDMQGTKNLASVQGSTVTGNSFVFRLTSRDTGRKFDIKLTFNEKVLEEDDENTLCNE